MHSCMRIQVREFIFINFYPNVYSFIYVYLSYVEHMLTINKFEFVLQLTNKFQQIIQQINRKLI